MFVPWILWFFWTISGGNTAACVATTQTINGWTVTGYDCAEVAASPATIPARSRTGQR